MDHFLVQKPKVTTALESPPKKQERKQMETDIATELPDVSVITD